MLTTIDDDKFYVSISTTFTMYTIFKKNTFSSKKTDYVDHSLKGINTYTNIMMISRRDSNNALFWKAMLHILQLFIP